jgi:hypothetical protein
MSFRLPVMNSPADGRHFLQAFFHVPLFTTHFMMDGLLPDR